MEVDIANCSDSKLPIYQAIAVPEIWLYQQAELTILGLQADGYQPQTHSLAFPAISVTQLNQWMQLRQTGTDLTVIRAVRQACQTQSS